MSVTLIICPSRVTKPNPSGHHVREEYVLVVGRGWFLVRREGGWFLVRGRVVDGF